MLLLLCYYYYYYYHHFYHYYHYHQHHQLTLYFIPERPTVAVEPQKAIVNVTQGVSFECRSRGQPPPQVRWIRTDIYSDYKIMLSPDGLTSTLSLSRTSPEDTGSITCIASSIVGEERAVTSLYVYCKYL